MPLRQASIRAALAAVLALAVAPDGFFTVAQFTTKMAAMTGQTDADYTTRQGACDLRKLRGKQLVAKPGRTWRYHVPEAAARTIAALLTIRDQVIARLLAGARTPRRGRPPATWTRIDRDHEALRVDMQPVPGPRPHHRTSRRIENELSIALRQVACWSVEVGGQNFQAAVVADRAADCDLGPFELTQPRC